MSTALPYGKKPFRMFRIDQDWCSLCWGSAEGQCAGWDTDYQASAGNLPSAHTLPFWHGGAAHSSMVAGVLTTETCGTDLDYWGRAYAAPTGSVYGKAVVRCAAGAPAGGHVEAILIGNATHYIEALIYGGAINTLSTAYACDTSTWRTVKLRLDVGGTFELWIDGVSKVTGTANVLAYPYVRFGKLSSSSDNYKYEWQSVQVRHGVDPDALAALGAHPCYNTPGTCQNAAAYIGTTKTYRFCDVDGPRPAPGQIGPIYPAVKNLEVYGTSIDIKLGLGARQKLSCDLADFADPCFDTDPYRAFRTVKSASTFFRTWLVRNPYYEGRDCCSEIGEIDENGIIDLANVTRLWFIMDTMDDPTGGPESIVHVEAKDRLAMLDKAVAPVATDGVLAADLLAAGVATTVDAGSGAQYGTAPFYFKVDDEIILVTARTVDSFDTITRGTWGTTAAHHDVGAKCQLCLPLDNVSISSAWNTLLTAAGVSASNIDLTSAAADVAMWQSGFLVKRIVTEPTLVADLIAELCEQWGLLTWDEAETSLVKMRSLHPPSVGGTVTELNDVQHLCKGGFTSYPMREDRITTVAIWYGVMDWSKPLDDSSNYYGVQIAVDAQAVSQPQYRGPTTKTIYASWIPATMSSQVASSANRRLMRFRDPPRKVTHLVTETDGNALRAGSLIELTTNELVDADGAPKPTQVWLLAKVRADDSRFIYELTMQTDPSMGIGAYGFYAPDGHPDWGVATEAQRAYGYYAGVDGKVGGTVVRWYL